MSGIKPKRLEEHQVYTSRVFEVYEGKILLPDGRTASNSWITHKPVIAAVPVSPEGKLLLIRQYRAAVEKMLLEIPAGVMDKGAETIEECVQRELAEEIGFQARTLIKLFEGYMVPGYCNEYMHYYLAMDLFSATLPPDADEVIEIVPTSFQDAIAMVRNGQIIDSKTALGITLAWEYLKNRS
ncbi:ADP-ribose pyrophosphatase [Syntrophus gentianae]|uniref:GDP-mannose pyrophosphatase n=1 Tax=Syntrophus gentianae TaxID=43775 RepID=A0A1H7VME4_9BACT|nr:NUDIX hydrolase [Syntrophus gentianae]SEM10431.1 ADP-ribose pyrophosphatase [Syntrophus gentianae]